MMSSAPVPSMSLMEVNPWLLVSVPLLALVWWLSTRRPKGLPPGPGWALPLLGHLYMIQADFRPQYKIWRRRFGDVFSLYMGPRLVVVINGHQAIKEAFVKQAEDFSDRPPHMFLMDKVLKRRGVLSTCGQEWKEQRKMSLEILRHFGMGKNLLADKIQEEVTHYIQAIADEKGSPVDLTRMTQISVSNNICSILLGKRFNYDDPDFCQYVSTFNKIIILAHAGSLGNIIPELTHLPGDMFNLKNLTACVDIIDSFIERQIHQHKQDLDTNSPDFIHEYLKQIQRLEKSLETTTVNEKSLHGCVFDLFFAGTETTSTALMWAILFFLHRPDVQEKCFQEIRDVVGTHRLPGMRDKQDMTYLQATMMEILRKGDITPSSGPRGATKDINFRGYIIPKGAMIILNLNSVLTDPDVWGDPENFRPERFIGPDGKLINYEELTPFALGRRVCLGESLARMELFLYLSTLIQRFRFLPQEQQPLPSVEGILGITNAPKPFKVRAVARD